MGDPYLPLIEQLATSQPASFVFGGYAEDALLHGRVSRPHDDLDVLVARPIASELIARLEGLGFRPFDVLFEPVAGRPLVLGSSRGSLNVELGLYDGGESMRPPSFVIPWADRPFRVTLPDDTLDHPTSAIDGVPIRTISPLALYQLRATFVETAVFGPPRPKDHGALELLRDRLLADRSDEDLRPRIEPV